MEDKYANLNMFAAQKGDCFLAQQLIEDYWNKKVQLLSPKDLTDSPIYSNPATLNIIFARMPEGKSTMFFKDGGYCGNFDKQLLLRLAQGKTEFKSCFGLLNSNPAN